MGDQTDLNQQWQVAGLGDMFERATGVRIPSIPGSSNGEVRDRVTEGASDIADSGKFRLYMGRIESSLDDVPHDKLGIENGKPSEVIKFMQNALHNLGYTDVKANGIVSKKFLQDLNGYIVAKKPETDGIGGVLGNYKDLPGVKSQNDITGAHLQAIVDSLRDADKLGIDDKKALEAYGKALGAIDNPDIQEWARDIGIPVPDSGKPHTPPAKDQWGATERQDLDVVAAANIKPVL